MLNYHNSPIIRHSILTKLDAERGIKILDIKIKRLKDGIGVKIEALIDGTIEAESRFELPPQFELIAVHNQIDEIAESYKKIRFRTFGLGLARGIIDDPNKPLAQTGLRYGWR